MKIQSRVKITAIRLDRMRLPLDPPFRAAWDPVPRRHFDATLVRVETDEGITGFGSGDTMDGFAAFADLFIGPRPLAIARHVRTIETINFHAGRYWPLEAACGTSSARPAGSRCPPCSGRLHDAPGVRVVWRADEPGERADAVLAAQAAGFRAVKIRIDRADVAAGLAAVRAGAHGGRRRHRDHGRPQPVVADAGDISPALDVRRAAAGQRAGRTGRAVAGRTAARR
jgi:L-alanine-DL-glutamate epimerase-like enolase superfamily enzyme